MIDCLSQYYRCPEHYLRFVLKGPLSGAGGYFRFGTETLYGRFSNRNLPDNPTEPLPDASLETTVEGGNTHLPFDLAQVIDGLRCEKYTQNGSTGRSIVQATVKRLYYLVRPLLPVAIRKHLQQMNLTGWKEVKFPQWPVDRTVDNVFEHLLLLALRSSGADRIPFIWFWPEGAPSCAIVTHDVETRVGRDSCAHLMDIDDSFGIKAAFQVVPEERYPVTADFLKSITSRGFGLGVQDLNHDGNLYRSQREFRSRAAKINSYGREWEVEGFRAAVLYRRQEWFDALDFSYDMSVPNVAHLDPQHGGCCTVMPFFVGKMLELPVTTTQDYMLFHILNDYSIDLWKRQIRLIMEKNGLISFIVHPDYVIGPREEAIYKELLGHLAQLRDEEGVWIALPDEVNRWWRQRAEMKLVEQGPSVRIEGEGSERACIAYASEKDGRLTFDVQTVATAGEIRQAHA
jgi:hypothetical protein